MIFVPYLLAVAALGASDAAAAPIRRAATQLTDDATAAWVSRCEQSGGGQYCVELGVDGQLALQSSADVCAQLNVTEQMVDLAKTLNGDTEMVRLTQLFAQQPRDSADGLSVLYCQTAPKHTELTGLYPCQYDSNNLSSFTNRAAAGAQGTRPFGTITVNPAGSCPAHTSGPIPSGKLLGSLVSDPGVKNVRVNSGVAGAAAKAKSGKAAVNTNSYNSYPNYNSYNNYRNNYYAGYGSYGANTNKIANTNYNSGGSRKSKAVVSSSYQQPTRYGSHYPWKFSLVARDDDDDEDAAAQPPPPPPAADNSAQTSTTSSAPASTPATTTPDLNAQQGVTDPNAAAVQQPPNGSMNPNLMFGMNGPQGMTNPMMGNQMYPGMNPMMNPYTGMPQMQPGMNSLASMQQPGNNPLTGMPQSNPFASMQQSQMTGMQQPGVNPMQDPTMQMMAMQQQGTTPPGTTPPGMAPPQMQATTQPPLSLSSIISSIGTALSGATTALSSAATAFTQVAWGVGNLTMTLSPPTTSPPMTPPPNTPPHCIQHYISVQGDTCDTLAMKFGLSASDVYNANTFLNCQNIWVGTPICVPPPSTPQQQQQQMAQQPPLSGMQQGPQPGMQGPQPGQQFPDPSQMAQQQPPQGAQQPGFPQTQSQAFQMPPGQVDPSQLAAQGQQQQPPFGQQQPSSFGQQGPQPGSPQMMDPSMQQFGGQQQQPGVQSQQPGVQSQQLPPQTQAFAVPPTQQQQQGTTQSFGSQQPGSQQPSPFSGHFSAHQKSNKMANTRPTANYMTGQPQRKSVTYSSGSWQGQSSEAAQAAYDRIQQAQQQQQQAYDDLARLQSGATQTYSNAETRNAAAFSKAKVQHKSAMGGSNEVAMGGSNLVSTAGNLDAYTRMLAAQMQMQQAQNDLNNLYSSATTGYATTGSQRVASSKAFSGYNGFAFNGYNNNAASRKSAVPAQSATMSTGGQFQPYSRVNHMYGTPQYGSGSTYVNPLSSTGFGTQHKAMKHSAMMKDMSDPNDPNANGGQCNHGDQQCMNGGFAQCVWGTWQVSPCGEGTQCFALPNGDGSNAFVCDTPEDAAMRMGGGSPPPQDPNAGQQDPNAGQQDPSQADPNAGQDQSQQQQEQPQPDPSQQQPPAEGGGDDGW